MRTANTTPIYGRFMEVRDITHSYPQDVDIMDHLNGPNWHLESFMDLHNEDAIWVYASMGLKRMGLH